MPLTEGYLLGVAPKLDMKGDAGNIGDAILRTRNWRTLRQDPAFGASESFDASKRIYSDFKNGTLLPEFHHNTIPGSLNTKGYYKNDQGNAYAVIRDVYDPTLQEKRIVKLGPDGLNLNGQEYVSQFFYDKRGKQFQNDQNTIAFPRPIIDYARFVKGKENGRMDYEKALYARQLMNGLRETLERHGVNDKYLRKRGLPDGLDSFSGDIFDILRETGDANVLAALSEFTGLPLMTIQAPRGENVNEDPNRIHTKNYDAYFDDYNNLSNFMKENYGDAAYSDGYTETPVNLFANGGRLSTRKDNLFSPSHIFADGGRMKRQRQGASPETVDFFSRRSGTPMTIEELNRMREQYYAEQDEKARQEKEMRDFVIKQREQYFKKQEEDRLRMAEEARNRWFNGQPSTDTSDKTEEQPAETGNSKSWWLNPLSPEWLKIAYNPNPKQKNESVTTQPRAAQNSEASGKSNNQVANTNDEIDKLALDVIRGKYGNGKQRREALGDLYSVVQKRANEMLKGKRSKENSSTRERQVADAYRKAWDDTPEEYKQPLKSKSFNPRIFNPRTYDLTTDDLRLRERAAQQAQQSRSLDDAHHSLIRDNGEVKRRIGGTNNYDIYL